MCSISTDLLTVKDIAIVIEASLVSIVTSQFSLQKIVCSSPASALKFMNVDDQMCACVSVNLIYQFTVYLQRFPTSCNMHISANM